MTQKPESICSLEKELNIVFEEVSLELFIEPSIDWYFSPYARAGFILDPSQQVLGLGFKRLPITDRLFEGFKNLQYLFGIRNGLQHIPNLKHLPQMSRIWLIEDKITDLSNLGNMTSLTTLSLNSNQIQDLSPIADLTFLTELILESNQIQDLSPIADLTSLTELYLGSNQIQDLSPIADLTKLTVLFLGNNQIQDLAPIADLTSLTKLYLNGNQIQDLSHLVHLYSLTSLMLDINQIRELSHLAHLVSLTELYLGRNHIQDLTPLTHLTSLTELYLPGNQILDLTPLAHLTCLNRLNIDYNQIENLTTLAGLSSLTKLYLSGNQIQDLSPLAHLTCLTELSLVSNQIQDLSPLAGMTSLTELSLGNNQIQDLSPLADLTCLTELYLTSNQIQDLSPIVGMTSLTKLYLGGNQIQDLSPLAHLTCLTKLYLDRNQIQDLSPLAHLTCLTELYLVDNQIQDLSPLADLTSLTFLQLSDNQIQDLSPLLQLIRKGAHIILDHNPMDKPPLEICDHGNKAILAWFEAPGERRRLNEVKVLLVGAGAAGKTSLTRALLGEPFDEEEVKTDGIRISAWPCTFQDQEVRVRLWDFGGQEIMHATHQFFMTQRCLYLLVLDGRKEEGLVDYWFKLIKSFGGESPILVVLNKVDQHPNYDLNQSELKEKYPSIQGFVQVSAKSKKGLHDLINQIQMAFTQVKLVSSIWPEPWLKVKQELETCGKDYLDLDRYHEICSEHQVDHPTHRVTLLAFLNDLGVALHFDEIELLQTQVLSPAWVTQPVYKLINHARLCQSQGVLVIDQLPHILPQFPIGRLAYLKELMSKFEICHPLPVKRLLLPDLLSTSQPSLPELGEQPLKLWVQYDFLPRSIIVRLMVQLYLQIENGLQWRTGMCLYHVELESRAIIRVDYEQKAMHLSLAGPKRKEFLAIILSHLRQIHTSFEQIGVEEKVICPCEACLKDSKPFMIGYTQLQTIQKKGKKDFCCLSSGNDVSIENLLEGVYLQPTPDLGAFRAALAKYRPSFAKEDAFNSLAQLLVPAHPGVQPITKEQLDDLIEEAWKAGLRDQAARTQTEEISVVSSPQPAPAIPQLCWLHLSDLHYKPKNTWDSERILRLLREDAASVFAKHKFQPQLLFATGDLGYGQESNSELSLCDQIKETLTYLEAVAGQFGIPRENIFMVPGNHDVNRTKTLKSLTSWCKDLVKDPNASRNIAEMMNKNDEDWRGLQKRVQDYLDAVSQHNYDLYLEHHQQAVYHQVRHINGVALGVFGFNGVWSCGSDDLKGKLLLGADWQLNLADKHLAETQLNFGLIHHPPSWYCEFEQKTLEKRLDQSFQILLHGHEHKDWVHKTALQGASCTLRVAAGASYTTNTQELGYNIGSLNLKTGNGKIHLRTYSDDNWIPKIIKDKADKGSWSFKIQIKNNPQRS